MVKQAAFNLVGEPATGIAETKGSGDVALGGALVRGLNSIDDAAQKAALRAARLSARTICRCAGREQIPTGRNTIHG